MDIHKGIEKIAENTNGTIQKQKEEAMRSLNQTNMSPTLLTKDIIIAESQALAESNHDRKKSYKLCKMDEDVWWCWTFNKKNPDSSIQKQTKKCLYSVPFPKSWESGS